MVIYVSFGIAVYKRQQFVIFALGYIALFLYLSTAVYSTDFLAIYSQIFRSIQILFYIVFQPQPIF